MEIAPRSQPLMQESSRPPKFRIDFANDGAIIENHDVLQKIGQYLLSSKHTLTLGQLMHLALSFKTICGF